MTLEEAQMVADIVAKADGGCEPCVERLVEKLREQFPDFEWTIAENFYDVERPVTVAISPQSKLALLGPVDVVMASHILPFVEQEREDCAVIADIVENLCATEKVDIRDGLAWAATMARSSTAHLIAREIRARGKARP